jgi:hypothetical protein
MEASTLNLSGTTLTIRTTAVILFVNLQAVFNK